MQKNVLEYLDNIVQRVPDKMAYSNGTDSLTFTEVWQESRAIGTFLNQSGLSGEPVVVFMERHPRTIVAFYGVIYSGNFYVPLDEEMPRHRIELIFKNLKPRAMICDAVTRELAESFADHGTVYLYDDIVQTLPDTTALAAIRRRAIDTDPIYIVFTSGSTGIPKGVVASHRSVIDYIESLCDILQVHADTVFGNQTPLYFDACLKELYPTLKFGASAYIIPKSLFMFPLRLVEYLNQHQINTVCWVVTALTMISGLNVLDKLVPASLRTIAFASEVFPIKQFNRWRQALPAARFINLYGPTEATGVCCFYEVDREFALDEVLPIGRPFPNTDILLLTEDHRRAAPGEPGEICVRGSSLTHGYYQDFEKTASVFVQNPLNTVYPELIYRTGDLGRYNDRGELVFISRKDYQIKHMGHRIEMGEIEVIASMHEGVAQACCVHDKVKSRIVLCYAGPVSPAEITSYLKVKLPRYMIPNAVEQLERLPLTTNSKIDRKTLTEAYTSTRRD